MKVIANRQHSATLTSQSNFSGASTGGVIKLSLQWEQKLINGAFFGNHAKLVLATSIDFTVSPTSLPQHSRKFGVYIATPFPVNRGQIHDLW